MQTISVLINGNGKEINLVNVIDEVVNSFDIKHQKKVRRQVQLFVDKLLKKSVFGLSTPIATLLPEWDATKAEILTRLFCQLDRTKLLEVNWRYNGAGITPVKIKVTDEVVMDYLKMRTIEEKPYNPTAKPKAVIKVTKIKDGEGYIRNRHLEELETDTGIGFQYPSGVPYYYDPYWMSVVKPIIISKFNQQVYDEDPETGRITLYGDLDYNRWRSLLVYLLEEYQKGGVWIGGNCKLDSRCRAIMEDARRLASWQNCKWLRCALTMDKKYWRPLSKEGQQYLAYSIGSMLKKGDTLQDRVEYGLKVLNQEVEVPLDEGDHETYMIHRAVQEWQHKDEYWSLPWEFDQTCSAFYWIGAVTGNVELLQRVNGVKDSVLHDGYRLKSLTNEQNKKYRNLIKIPCSPTSYGSFATVNKLVTKEMLKHPSRYKYISVEQKKLVLTDEQLEVMKELEYAFEKGGEFYPTKAYARYLSSGYSVSERFMFDLYLDKFTVQCNKLEETDGEGEHDGERVLLKRHKHKAIMLDPRQRGKFKFVGITVPYSADIALDRMGTYFPSLLIHHLDAMAMSSVCLSFKEEGKFILTNHDAAFIHPNDFRMVNDGITQMGWKVYSNRKAIREAVRASLGIKKPWVNPYVDTGELQEADMVGSLVMK